MAISTQERIERLLDQLEDPNLTVSEIDKVKKKIDLLESLDR